MQIDNSFHEELETEEVKINGREKKEEKKKRNNAFLVGKITLSHPFFFSLLILCVFNCL